MRPLFVRSSQTELREFSEYITCYPLGMGTHEAIVYTTRPTGMCIKGTIVQLKEYDRLKTSRALRSL